MKTNVLLVTAASICVAGLMSAHASLYNLGFTQTGETDTYGHATPTSTTTAIGQLEITGSQAQSGNLTVMITTGSDLTTATYALVAGSGNNGTFQYDNVVYTTPVNGGFLDGSAGLLWTLTSSVGTIAAPSEMNMWYNAGAQYGAPAGSYSLWGAQPKYNPESYGTASLTAASVPEPSTVVAGMLLLLPFGISTARVLRKHKVA